MSRARLASTACAALLLFSATGARAQLSEVQLERGPVRDLYVKKRPAVPESPKLPKELQALLERKEKKRNAKRKEAIGLLRAFLDSKPTGDSRAEGLFKLAELLWEESRIQYVADMDKYDRALEKCRVDHCRKPPVEPRLDFSESAQLYKTILEDHPNFRRTDLILYLVGFSEREAGHPAESLGYFQQVIQRFPQSPLYGDSWMMIGEYYFANLKWELARQAYANVLKRPDAPTYDLALFKTAWCDWKLGEIDKAALRFKKVLDLAVEAERSGSARLIKRRAQLRDEALEYLVIVFTEDQSISAKDIYEFLASIGGERYSHDILVRVADSYQAQADYDRAVDTYRFLIDLKPTSIQAAAHQRRIVETRVEALDDKAAVAEMKTLVDKYGPGSDWAAENKRSGGLKRSLAATEKLVRETAKNFHAEAQQEEKSNKDANMALYHQAADAYSFYLSKFGDNPNAVEVRFLRAEILFFKLKKYEEAGDEYFAVGKSAPVGKYHKDALLKAMEAYERARPKNVAGKRELVPVDRKFAAAVDLYATLFPADPELVGVVFRNGQMFYDYGDYDEAIKRFGLIVTKYPNDPNAGPAGDRILGALKKAEDYENIEHWARELKKAKAFQSADQQKRLDRLIVESIGKSGEKYGKAGKYARAANFYLRIPKEYPKSDLAPQSLFNAAIMLEKAKRPEAAGATYLSMADKYPKSKLSAKATFTAGQVFESMAYFDRAAEAYETCFQKYPRSQHAADCLFNAGVLRQALGQPQRAIRHYQAYAKKHRDRKDAPEVAFRIGVVYEAAGDQGRADRAYRDYARRYRHGGAHLIEAHTRSARLALSLGHTRRASKELETALSMYKRLKGDDATAQREWAAEARYLEGELIYRDYKKIKLDVKPRKLEKTLDKKFKMLEKAQTVYLGVVDVGDLQWGTAALERIGQIYEEFAKSLRDAPIPSSLSKSDADLYREALENKIVQIEDRAIEVYTAGYQKALDLKVFNKHTKGMREALGRMAANQFPPEHEIRLHSRVGDRPPKLKMVTEVVRGDE